DPDRRARQLHVLHRLVLEQSRVVGDEPDRIGEGSPAEGVGEQADHAFLQGVSARPRRTRSASAARARRIASPPAAMISVLNTSWPIPMKIGLPSPAGM